MTSNPLAPPDARRPGTVGRATRLGVRVAVLDTLAQGRAPGAPATMLAASTLASPTPTLLPGDVASASRAGEVCVEGATLFGGYAGPTGARANAEAFTSAVLLPRPASMVASAGHNPQRHAAGDWFRTGDIGTMSSDGFLTLEGRIKELINRAGEKISPLEVDAVLLALPGIVEAVSFGAADATYGEEVHCAIVLRPGASVSAEQVRAHCGQQLAAHKVPRVVHIAEALPRTATGKIQRRKVAAHFAAGVVRASGGSGASGASGGAHAHISNIAPAPTVAPMPQTAPRTANPDGYTLVANALAQSGVRMVFGVVGIPITPLATAAQAAGVRFIAMRTETAAGYAACAWGYLTGHPAALLAVSGPGAVNAIAGACHAEANRMPLVVLCGACSTDEEGLGGFQEADQRAMMRPHCAVALRPNANETDAASGAALSNAIRLAVEAAAVADGVPRAAYVDLPADMLLRRYDRAEASDASEAAGSSDVVELSGSLQMQAARAARGAAPGAVREAAELLASASRPLLIVGQGAAHSAGEVAELARALDAPFVPLPMGKGVVPDSNDLNASAARSTTLRECDVCVVVGGRLDWMLGLGRPPTFAHDVKFVLVTADVADASRHAWIGVDQGVKAQASRAGRVHALALTGAVGRTSLLLANELRAARLPRSREAQRAWKARVQATASHRRAELDARLRRPRQPLDFYAAFGVLRSALLRVAPEPVVIAEGANTMDMCRLALAHDRPLSKLDAGAWGTMGVGLPYAIAAALRQPQRLVVAIEGDSALGFSLAELETAARFKLGNLLVLVMNNGGIYVRLRFDRVQNPKQHSRWRYASVSR